jgi:hypothetical protein
MHPENPDRVLDPRGKLRLTRIALAPRPSAAALASGTLLFTTTKKWMSAITA